MNNRQHFNIVIGKGAPSITTAPPNRLNGRVWPSGDFGLGYGPRAGWEPALDTHIDEHGRDVQDREASPPLGLSLPSNSHKRGQRGLKGITSRGKKMVRSVASLLQRKYGKGRLSFLTLTLPSLTPDELLECSADWSRIVRVFQQWLKRQLVAAGLSPVIAGVTEIQPGRLEKRQELGLHLHVVFCGRQDRGPWVLQPGAVREAWLRTIQTSIGSVVCSESVENLQRVESNAAGYLGKYMSKGPGEVAKVLDVWPDAILPTAWWFCTSEARAWVMSEMVTSDSALELVERWVMMEYEAVAYSSPIELEGHDGHKTRVGWCGRVTEWGRRILMEF